MIHPSLLITVSEPFFFASFILYLFYTHSAFYYLSVFLFCFVSMSLFVSPSFLRLRASRVHKDHTNCRFWLKKKKVASLKMLIVL